MPAVAISPTVRSILLANIDLPADEVIKKAKEKGVTAPDSSIRDTIYNVKSALKKKAKKTAPMVAAAQTTKAPKAAPVSTPVSAPVSSSSSSDLSSMLANVALVNTVVDACGGIEQARQVTEAVRACGGVEAFLQHLDLVVTVRGGASA